MKTKDLIELLERNGEDGKFTITSVDRRVNGALKNVFEVTDETGNVIDTLPRLKDAKAKYAEI